MTPGEEKQLREQIADQITAWKFEERPPRWMGRDEVWQQACDDCAQIARGEQP